MFNIILEYILSMSQCKMVYEGVQNRKKCCGLIAHTGSVAVKRGVAATTAVVAGDIYIYIYVYKYI